MSKNSCNSNEEWSLEIIEIPNPCTVPWASMKGDATIRYCSQCEKNVYNISDMSAKQARNLLICSEGTVCITMLKRADGTVVSDECPRLLRPARDGIKWVAATIGTLLATIIGITPARADDKQAQPLAGSPVPPSTMVQPARLGGEPTLPALRRSAESKLCSGPISIFANDPKANITKTDFTTFTKDLNAKVKEFWNEPGKKGTAVGEFNVDKDGKVSNFQINQSSGIAEYDKEVLVTLSKLGTLKGVPKDLPAGLQVHYSFGTANSKADEKKK